MKIICNNVCRDGAATCQPVSRPTNSPLVQVRGGLFVGLIVEFAFVFELRHALQLVSGEFRRAFPII